jgi:hypothetical protein
MDPDDPADVQSDNPIFASTLPATPMHWPPTPAIQERLPDAPLPAAWAAWGAIFEIAPGNCPVLHYESLPRNRYGVFVGVKSWALCISVAGSRCMARSDIIETY